MQWLTQCLYCYEARNNYPRQNWEQHGKTASDVQRFPFPYYGMHGVLESQKERGCPDGVHTWRRGCIRGEKSDSWSIFAQWEEEKMTVDNFYSLTKKSDSW